LVLVVSQLQGTGAVQRHHESRQQCGRQTFDTQLCS
jgi:hypothetical protein